ncbi:MAG: Omp28-related outer membrane protein [Paludibacteraceae bacterium]|nr:Omp28-related outer membrane protein [Paludibacteraceae bacterium]
MKKTILSILLLVGFSLSIAAEGTIPTSFPRKVLLEQFTGQTCGNCPAGYMAINQAIYQNPDKYIWIAHHWGYKQDEYTISESKNITNIIDSYMGAPQVCLNRNYQKINGVKQRHYHPNALVDGTLTMLDADTAVLSVVIEREYTPATRELQITVHGQVADASISSINLSTLIKENSIAGEQVDYNFAWNGNWKEYLHMATIRDFYCSKAIGDEIAVTNQTYSKTYTVIVDSAWVDEHCTIVAFATKTDGREVYNAAETPLVEGTDGGNNDKAYGIIQDAQPKSTIVFSQILAQQKVDPNILQIMLLSNTIMRPDNTSFYYGTCKPVALLYVITTDNELQPGTYPVLDDPSFNSVVAGFRVDTLGSLGGSLLIYASAQYLQNKQIVAAATWRMQSGSLTMDKDGNIYFKVGTCYGTEVEGVYNISTAIGYTEQDADNQTIYNILGQPIDQDPTQLPQGVYIQNGSKFIKK